MKHSKGTILVVEDDDNQRNIIKTILSREGFYTDDANSIGKALKLMKSYPFDLVITDLKLPDGEGTEVLKEAKQMTAPCHVIIITAYGSIASAVEATKLGAFYYLEKPFEKDQLLLTVNNAMTQVQLLKDNIMLKDQLTEKFTLENIVSAHGRMDELFRIVRKVAPTNSTVLIYGESGTGKELFAKNIHFYSPRSKNTFFAINCAAIPETLLESELFGYEKGAFTGSLARHIGLFEQANGSTLFLDEIGDLSLNTQAKLLRVIQERELRRIGGKETIKLDVRIIAATNRRLEEEIKKGKFREDLYYRLNVITFSIPPLRERITDVPLLAEHFLKQLNESQGKNKQITNDALNILLRHNWPGNVRQLESVIERAYVMSDDETVGVEQIPEEVKQGSFFYQSENDFSVFADSLINAKLTAAEYRLYLYLLKTEADAGSSPGALEPKMIMEELDINKQTFYTGIARLRELGLYDYRTRSERVKRGRPGH